MEAYSTARDIMKIVEYINEKANNKNKRSFSGGTKTYNSTR